MKSKNLLSLLQSAKIDIGLCNHYGITMQNLLPPEKYEILKSFCNTLRDASAPFNYYDGYFLNCALPHNMCQFDLLRVSYDTVVNVQLLQISDTTTSEKLWYIEGLLYRQYYYLRHLNKSVFCFCYVLCDGLYMYDRNKNIAVKVDVAELFKVLAQQELTLLHGIDETEIFSISKYLVSPFHKTDRFARGEYFLTQSQDALCQDIFQKTARNQFFAYCISADAGTGKTLVVYDIARRMLKSDKQVLILHGGDLNDAHLRLKMQYRFEIFGKKDTALTLHCMQINNTRYDMVIVDEAQRFARHNIDLAINYCENQNVPIVFAYDTKQRVSKSDGIDVYEHIINEHSNIQAYKATLDVNFRNSPQIVSFCKKMFKTGNSDYNGNYDNVSIEYFEDKDNVKAYLKLLEISNYKTIGFVIKGEREKLCQLNINASVGQGFEKVALVLDDAYFYDAQNRLCASPKADNYDLLGSIYQIITRAQSVLKIIVLNNSQLYESLIKITHSIN